MHLQANCKCLTSAHQTSSQTSSQVFYCVLAVSKELEGTVLLLAILAAVWSFAFGVGPIPWLDISQILPERIKGRAAALFTSLNWVASLCVGLNKRKPYDRHSIHRNQMTTDFDGLT